MSTQVIRIALKIPADDIHTVLLHIPAGTNWPDFSETNRIAEVGAYKIAAIIPPGIAAADLTDISNSGSNSRSSPDGDHDQAAAYLKIALNASPSAKTDFN